MKTTLLITTIIVCLFNCGCDDGTDCEFGQFYMKDYKSSLSISTSSYAEDSTLIIRFIHQDFTLPKDSLKYSIVKDTNLSASISLETETSTGNYRNTPPLFEYFATKDTLYIWLTELKPNNLPKQISKSYKNTIQCEPSFSFVSIKSLTIRIPVHRKIKIIPRHLFDWKN
ncbi:MAG: hypothetical protein U0Y96_06280 [Candidatus Kapaibacterium sp.]|nr:hypothetical protein [Bacteroidota bacterium]